MLTLILAIFTILLLFKYIATISRMKNVKDKLNNKVYVFWLDGKLSKQDCEILNKYTDELI